MLTMSPLVPVISVMCVTRRVPSLIRETCTMSWTADAICCRTAFSGRLRLAIMRHGFNAGERVTRAVGVNGGDGTIVTGVHRL